MGVYINGVWYEPPEIQAYVNDLLKQRDAYKQELIGWLEKASECVVGDNEDCSICPYYYVASGGMCPSKVSMYAARLRLEELRKEK